METYYDVHCHYFNKNILIRRLVNVIQSVLTLKDILEKDVTPDEVRFKLRSIEKTLNDVNRFTCEEVFEQLDNVYGGKLVTTPLMFDLTYADDNDDDEHHNKRYRKRIKRVFWLLSIALPFIKKRAIKKLKDPSLGKDFDNILKNVKEFNKSFKKRTDKEVEIFDDSNYNQQIVDLENLADKFTQVKPFFSVDPRREYKGKTNMLEKVREKLLAPEAKFAGVKLYAPAGFSPTDPVLMGTPSKPGIYALCQENNIPITVHNSNAGFSCFSSVLKVRGHVYLNGNIVRPQKPLVFDYRFFSRNVSKAISERAKKLNHPKLWELVLKKYPNLTINFAHFGGSGQIMEYINYDIPYTKVDEDEFEAAIAHLQPKKKKIIESAYTKRRGKMYLNDMLTTNERAVLWNVLYAEGFIDNWAKAIFDLVKNPNYPNAYTDLSCFSTGRILINPNTQEQYFSIKDDLETFKHNFYMKLSDYEKSKILYGSDYYLTQFFGPSMDDYFGTFKTVFNSEFDRIASENPKRFLN